MKLIDPPAEARQVRPDSMARTFRCPPGLIGCEPASVLVDRSDEGAEVIRLYWQPEGDEVERLAAGEPVLLTIWGRGMPPVDVAVGL